MLVCGEGGRGGCSLSVGSSLVSRRFKSALGYVLVSWASLFS